MLQSDVFFVWNFFVFLCLDIFVLCAKGSASSAKLHVEANSRTGESRTAARNRRKRALKAEYAAVVAAAQAGGGQTLPASGGQAPPAGYDPTLRPQTRRQRREAMLTRALRSLEDLLPPPDTEQDAASPVTPSPVTD